MKKDLNYKQIARYVAGECSNEEVTAFEARMKIDPELSKVVNELRKIWRIKKNKPSTWDVESAWKRFNKELERTQKTHLEKPVHNKTVKTFHKSKKTLLLRIAAVFMVVGFTSLFAILYFGDLEQKEQLTAKEVVTEKGQRVQVQLKDGSRIHLNADSKITYPGEFASDKRTVHLTGEAYFDINHEERPFFVYTDGVEIGILGTEFNVRAYEEEDVEIVVANGKVGVRLTQNINGESAILQRGEMVSMGRNGESGLTPIQRVDLHRYLGWMKYRLTFDNEPMNRVFTQLERWYGVDIDYTDPTISELTLSAIFEDEPLQAVLQVIKLALNVEYEIQGNKVTFYPEF